MKKAKYNRNECGKLFVDCAECDRGGNGSDKDKCSCGWMIKKGRKGGCFIGVLIPGMEVKV